MNHELFRLVGHDEDLCARFLSEACKVGMQARLVSEDELEGALAQTVNDLGCATATLSMAAGPLLTKLRRALGTTDCQEVDWRQGSGIDCHYDVDLGITDAIHGVAETGSLILNSAASRSRGAHLAPPIHLAVLWVDQILPDLIDFFQAQGTERVPRAQVIVTGPSKTADIEGVLVTGVHGPKEVHILLVQRLGNPAS